MSHDSDKRIPDARVIEKEQEETVTLKEAPASEDNEAAEKSSCSVPANSSAQSSISVSRAESAQSHTMQPVRSAATDTVKPPKLYIGFLIALASTTLLTAWISSFRGTGYLEFGQYPHSFVLSYHFGSFAIFAPFLIYIGTCFSSLSQAFGKRFGKTKPLSFSMTTLLTFISVVAMPAYTILNIQSGGVGNYIRAEYPWLSLSDLALVFWMLIQMVCPIVFFRFLRKMEPSRSFLTPLIFPMLGAIDYALCLNFEKFLGQNYKDMFFAFWIITQISGIKYFWTQLASPKQHESTNPIQPSESMKAEKDTIIQYHPFAALSRWQKQQERALNKELKLVLCLAIPVMCFCFYMSYGFLKDAETRAAWDRVNANQAQTRLEANMREVRYRENLSQMMAELKSRDNKISNYVARFTLNSYGQIHSQVQLNARNSTDMSGEELEKRLKEESRFRQMIIDAQPLPSFDPVMTSGNLLPVVVDFGSPGENYSGVGVVIGRGAANLPGTTKALSAIAANQLASNVVISRIEQDANRAVPYYLGFGFLATLVGLFAFLSSKPTQIGINPDGWRFLFSQRLVRHGKYLKWADLERIYMERPKKSTSPLDDNLCFRSYNGKVERISMGSIESIEDREFLLKAIEKYAPNVPRDPSVSMALQPPADHSYTELWLQALSAPPKRERLKPLAKGTSLKKGRYLVLDEIGAGGLGHAYLASNDQGEQYVLKECILPVYVDVSVRRSSLEQFENEARLLRQIDHPQIVKLIDFFVEDHRTYLVLEHIDGKSLRQIVKNKGALKESDVRSLAIQMCEMLRALHSMNPPVIHRDFTPDNLILHKDGTLKLIDFNVAKQVVESTTSGTVVGKHAYLPPEQFRGMPERASDIYAMGATLHYLLCGKDPDPISTSHPNRVNSQLSDSINSLVERATALDLAKRYKDIEELRKDLLGD